MSSPVISVIIANFNGKKHLSDCLESLSAQTFRDFEVIVVDNGSTDGSVELLEGDRFSYVRLIRSVRNLGFASGNNMGIAAARGKYIMTLNNDTRLEEDCIEQLIEAALGSGGMVGMWAPKILSDESPHLIDSVGGLLISIDGIGKGRGRLEADTGKYDNIKEILFPSACAALYRRRMLEDVGFFDGDFFAYCEDTDLGMRARLKGWKAFSVPKAIVYHAYSVTGEKYSPFKAFLVERNHFLVVMKNFPLRLLLLSPFCSIYRYFIQAYGVIAKRGAGGKFLENESAFILLYTLIKSISSAIARTPLILGKRWDIQKGKKISSKEMLMLLKAHNIKVKDLVLMD